MIPTIILTCVFSGYKTCFVRPGHICSCMPGFLCVYSYMLDDLHTASLMYIFIVFLKNVFPKGSVLEFLPQADKGATNERCHLHCTIVLQPVSAR